MDIPENVDRLWRLVLDLTTQSDQPGGDESPALTVQEVTGAPRTQTQRRLGVDEVAQLVEGYRAGTSVRELAANFGVHRTTVLAHLERHSVARRVAARALSNSQIREAIELYERGLSCATIATRYGVHGETIRRTLLKAGVQMRPRRGARPYSRSLCSAFLCRSRSRAM